MARVQRLALRAAALFLLGAISFTGPGVAPVRAQRPRPLVISGGTWVDRDSGLIGTGFVFNPIVPGGTILEIEIQGPAGWNTDNPFTCGLFQPPGIAPDRSMCWDAILPVTGWYTARTSIAGELFERKRTFRIDAAKRLTTPQIASLDVGPDHVTFEWSAPSSAKSFLLRVNPDPFTGTITAEMVVPGNSRSATLSGLSLVAGARYQAVVWGFSQDVKTPGSPRVAPFNLASDDVQFICEGPRPPTYSFGADTNVRPPLTYPRSPADGFDFYAGRLGAGADKCKIQKDGWDILHWPKKLVPVPPEEICQFQFEVVEDMRDKLGSEAARERTYGYWYLQGPKAAKGDREKWGRDQARWLAQQRRTYREWVDGLTLFADIEEPIEHPEDDTWEVCVQDETGGSVIFPEACESNRQVLRGFLKFVVNARARNYVPGIYTRPRAWVKYFGRDFIPRVIFWPDEERGRPEQRVVPFVLWLAGCASVGGPYDAGEAEEIQAGALLSRVRGTTLGGSRAVLWQYHLDKPDFDVTDQKPSRSFSPLTAPLAYDCTCSDPALGRQRYRGSCPELDNLPIETLRVSADGSVVTTRRSYPSYKTFRIEASGTYRWGLCDPLNCPEGGGCGYQRFGDAEHLTDDCQFLSTFDEWFGLDISLFMNGANVDWGRYNSEHVYSTEAPGRDGPFSFYIEDCPPCYGDNDGFLTVRIYELSR